MITVVRENDSQICLIIFGEVDRDELHFLPQALRDALGLPSRWGESLPLPEGSYNGGRDQYFAGPFLRVLAGMPDVKCLRLLGITGVDLYTKGLNFIFGQATIEGRECLISLARLRQGFYRRPEDPELFRERVVKEAVHELGHTFGLPHCSDPRCVMRFSNSLQDTDAKDHLPCARCRSMMMNR